VVLVGLVWWITRVPRNDLRFCPEQARLARAHVADGRAELENVRHFVWRSTTDFEPRWERRTIALDRVRGLDVFVSDWGWRHLVHTIVSWDIDGEPPLAISIESRREAGEPFEPVRGLLRQYELYYAVADERDVIALRTGHRGERVRLYRTSTSADVARRLLVAYLEDVERVAAEPAFYDSISRNCSTTTRRHVAAVGVADSWDWRVLFNGHVDELLYARGLLDDSLPLAELRARSDVTARAREVEGDPAFSTRLREGLPQPPRDP
jgi:hypothetical protein